MTTAQKPDAAFWYMRDNHTFRKLSGSPTEMLALPMKLRSRVHYAAPGPDRWKERSTTLRGIAEAMAEQWGNVDQFELEAA